MMAKDGRTEGRACDIDRSNNAHLPFSRPSTFQQLYISTHCASVLNGFQNSARLFIHSVLMHVSFKHLPSGKRYEASSVRVLPSSLSHMPCMRVFRTRSCFQFYLNVAHKPNSVNYLFILCVAGCSSQRRDPPDGCTSHPSAERVRVCALRWLAMFHGERQGTAHNRMHILVCNLHSKGLKCSTHTLFTGAFEQRI